METKACGKCHQEKLITEFYRHRGDSYQSRCHDCCRKDRRELAKTGYFARYAADYYQRPEVKERRKRVMRGYRERPEVRIKNMARWYTNHEIRSGRINREPCAICGKEQGQAHHADYKQPLLIVWLCADCHWGIHRKKLGEKDGN